MESVKSRRTQHKAKDARSNTVKEADRDLPRSSQAEGQHPPLIVVDDNVGSSGSWFLHSSSFGEVLAKPREGLSLCCALSFTLAGARKFFELGAQVRGIEGRPHLRLRRSCTNARRPSRVT